MRKKAAKHRKKNVIPYKTFTAHWNNWILNTNKKNIAKYGILSKKNRVDEVTQLTIWDYITRRDKTNLQLICTGKLRTNELINAEGEEDAAANILIKFKLSRSKTRRRNRKQLTLVGIAGLHGI